MKKMKKTDYLPKISSGGINPEDVVFALDIGTKKIAGIVGIKENGKFRIIETEVIEHGNRVMFDGQIHDINRVTEAVKSVKQKLQKRLSFSLTRVALAAAGRTLRTCEVKVEQEIDMEKEIDADIVNMMEIESIKKAQEQLDKDVSNDEKGRYYCVGYSVINYYLDGYLISNLVGHRGKKIGADVLATFLPRFVVDSLYTVTSRAGLEVMSLTLEPIAAMNVAIPEDLRILNIALVDIGAGTSDIAITKNGSVVAYAMIPFAGDEITERISHHCLVDFKTAERMKIECSTNKEAISYTDILGINHTISGDGLKEIIRPSVESLAEEIAKKILEYNQKSPSVVFLVGGGSQVSGLSGALAEYLGLPGERVIVKGRNIIKNIIYKGKKLSGPESVTPIGIAVTADMQAGKSFFTVTVDGNKVRMFNSKKYSVMDVLIFSGYNGGKLIGRSGKSLSFTLNGEKKVVRGGYGKAAEVYVNGKPSSLDTVVNSGDSISIIPAEDGKNAELMLEELAKQLGFQIDEIDEYSFFVNGREQSHGYKIKDSDIIEIKQCKPKKANIAESQQKPIVPEKSEREFAVTVNGKRVVLNDGRTQYIFVDIFNYINLDISTIRGNITLRLNGREAAFTDIIKPGDSIDIYWEN